MDDVMKALFAREADPDEPVRVHRVGEVCAESIVEGRGSLIERDAMLPEVRRSLALIPDEVHLFDV